MDKRKISIVIIEKDPQVRHDLIKSLVLDKAYNIIGMAEYVSNAQNLLMCGKADVVVLNADPDSLAHIKEQNETKPDRPIFIVTVEANRHAAARESLQTGADYFLMKPLCMDTVARCIKEVYFFKRLPPHSAYAGKESSGILEFAVKQLNRVPIGSHLKGYHFLLTGITALIEDETMKKGITKSLYPYIAKKWDSTPVRVERAIRNAISRAWENGCSDHFKALLGNLKITGSKPSNSQFMLIIADLYHSTRSDPR